MQKTILLILISIITINLASAIVINSVDTQTLAPGKEGTIRIEVKNIFNDDTEDVSLSLNFNNLPFIPIGTSTQTVDEIKEGDDEVFVFRIKASSSITPGDYEIPYSLEYFIQGDNELKARTGSIGIKVSADPILDFTATVDNPVINKQGTITLKIINKGFFDARFVSVRLIPEEFTLLSEKEVYVGKVSSDDFETVDFDVRFTKTNPLLTAIVEYVDFNNNKVVKNINLPLTVYSEKRAIDLGIIQPSQTTFYLSIAITIILIIIIWRFLRRRKRMNKNKRLAEN